MLTIKMQRLEAEPAEQIVELTKDLESTRRALKKMKKELNVEKEQVPKTVYTLLLYPALLFDWLITLTLTLTIFDDIILDKSAGSKSGVYVDLYGAGGAVGGPKETSAHELRREPADQSEPAWAPHGRGVAAARGEGDLHYC